MYYNDYLIHHGVKGMRWGHRKNNISYKTMSDEELQSAIKRKGLEQGYRKAMKGNSKLEKSKRVADASSNAINEISKAYRKSNESSKKLKRMDLSKMSDKELRDRINRENLERQYNNMFAEPVKVSNGSRYLQRTLEIAGGITASTASSLGIALAIKELRDK